MRDEGVDDLEKRVAFSGDLSFPPAGPVAIVQASEPSTVKRYYRVDKREIFFLRFVLEGCEGLAVLTTIDRHRGVVVASIAPGCEADFDQVLEDLKPAILMEPVSPDSL